MAARMRLSQPARPAQLASSVSRVFQCQPQFRARLVAWPSSASSSRPFTSAHCLLQADNRPPPRTYFQPGDKPPPPQYQSLNEFQPQAQPPPPPPPPPQYPSTIAEPGADSQGPSQPPPPPPRRRRRWFRWRMVLWLAFTGAFGAYASLRLRMALVPLQPPPGSSSDQILTDRVHREADKLDIVKKLSSDPAYESWQAYTSRPSAPAPPSPDTSAESPDAALAILAAGQDSSSLRRRDRLTTGPMGGYRGIGGYQRVWRHKATGEMVSVVYFGPSVQGWPATVHGGAIATLLDESLGRCAVQRLDGGTGVTAHLKLGYRRPTRTNNFYVVRCRFVDEEDLPERDRGEDKRGRKAWIRGMLETPDGEEMVEAVALFVAPKNLKLERISDRF